MNIEEDLKSLKEIVEIRKERCHGFIESDSCLVSTKRLETLLTAYEEEKEMNEKIKNASIVKVTANGKTKRINLFQIQNEIIKEINKKWTEKIKEIFNNKIIALKGSSIDNIVKCEFERLRDEILNKEE